MGVVATLSAAMSWRMTPSVWPLVSFQKELLVACEEMPNMGIGTCWVAHWTVGWTPTWLMPVIMTSGCLASMRL